MAKITVKLPENIEIGTTYKTFKELCEAFDVPKKYHTATSDSKTAVLKQIERYISYERKGWKYIVTKIYNEPIPDIDNRKIIDERFNVSDSFKDRAGVYKIQLNNEIYIGSTYNFRTRFGQHARGDHNTCYTKDLLDRGAQFSVLYMAPKKYKREDLFEMEEKYIQSYESNPDYILLNHRMTVNELHPRLPKETPHCSACEYNGKLLEIENQVKQLLKLIKELKLKETT